MRSSTLSRSFRPNAIPDQYIPLSDDSSHHSTPGLVGFKWEGDGFSSMSTATKIVLGTVCASALLSIALVLNLAIAA